MITRDSENKEKGINNFPKITHIYAKSERVCSYCNETINVGESCIIVSGKRDEKRTVCLSCNRAYNTYKQIKNICHSVRDAIDRENWIDSLGKAAAELEFRGFDMRKRFVSL